MGEGCGLVSIMDSRCLSYAGVLEDKSCLTLLFKLIALATDNGGLLLSGASSEKSKKETKRSWTQD